MATLIDVSDASDPQLDGYRDLREPERAARLGNFVAESGPVIRELVVSQRYELESVLLTRRRLEKADWVTRLPANTAVYVASDRILESVAGFRVHRGCLALGRRGERPGLDDVLNDDMRTVVLLDGIADPDNVGSIFRSGFALGADVVLLSASCADPLYRKAIRTSMGTVFRLPHARFDGVADAVHALRRRGFHIVALTPNEQAEAVTDFAGTIDRAQPLALLVGNEGRGLGAEALGIADVRVRVPMRPDADSVNVHVATAIVLAHLGRIPS